MSYFKQLLLFFLAFAPILTQGQATQKKFIVPAYFVAEAECYLQGPFDGDGSNTIIRFENRNTQSFSVSPIIESKNKLLIKIPDTYGAFELIIVDEGNNQSLFLPVRVVKQQMDFDKTPKPLKRPVDFEIQIQGAEKLAASFSLSIINKSPHVISIQGGNTQNHIIRSTEQTAKVSWSGKFIAISRDPFYIIGTLEQPAPTVKVANY